MTFETANVDKRAFNCPHCAAFAAMEWDFLQIRQSLVPIKTATCHSCKQFSVWIVQEHGNSVQKMVYPQSINAPLPNNDLPNECMNDYLEARSVAANSPRGAAALLRLCIQKLCIHLGGNGHNINEDIAALVKNGLSAQIQQALDVVRVVGNNAVHPGEISIEDKPEIVFALFGLVNLIVENQISQPKHVAALFSGLPNGAKEAVEKRDKN